MLTSLFTYQDYVLKSGNQRVYQECILAIDFPGYPKKSAIKEINLHDFYPENLDIIFQFNGEHRFKVNLSTGKIERYEESNINGSV